MSNMSDRDLLELIAAQVSNLTKMYSEMNEGFSELKQEITKTNLTIENDINPKLDALLDGYKQLAEGQQEIKKDIQTLADRQDSQELQIKVLKGAAK